MGNLSGDSGSHSRRGEGDNGLAWQIKSQVNDAGTSQMAKGIRSELSPQDKDGENNSVTAIIQVNNFLLRKPQPSKKN